MTKTTSSSPWVISYVAVGPLSGLSSVVTRSVTIVDPCAPAERTCNGTLTCSINGSCGASAAKLASLMYSLGTYASTTSDLASSSSSSASGVSLSASGGALAVGSSLLGSTGSAAQIAVALVTDNTPPTIIMLQGAYPTVGFVTASGASGLITNVTVGQPYVDPGATAFKVPPNNPTNTINLTSRILVSGLFAINTAAPTPPGLPFVITYDASDYSVPPNKAQTARRRIQVVCGGSEKICTNDDGSLSCSFGGICGVAVLASSSSSNSLAKASGTSVPTVNSINIGTASSSTGATNAVIPTISLLGPSTVFVPQGVQYGKCSGSSHAACEAGAIATLASMGDLNSKV